MAVTTQIIQSWRRPRLVMRRMLAGGQREDRALIFLMAGCLVIFVAQWPGLARQAHLAPEVSLNQRLGGALMGTLIFAPLLFYGVAALSHLAARLLGGQGSWFGARLALFWSLLAISPLVLFHGLVEGFIGEGKELALVAILGFLAFLAHWLLCLYEAERGEGAVEK